MISNISIESLRKIKNINLNTNYNLIIFQGANAVGKTTILEGIYLSSTASSFKTRDIKSLIRFNDDFARVSVIDDNNKYDVVISSYGRKTLINDNVIPRLSDFIGNLQVVLFSPSDINIIKGERSIRRNFFDLEISLRNKGYLKLISEFKKLLKKRNEILKSESIDDILLKTITSQMNERQRSIIKLRTNFINDLNNELKLLSNVLGYDEVISIKYNPSLKEEDLDKFYSKNLAYDKLTKITNYGIQKDDYVFYLNSLKSSLYASEGQQRSIALILKLALYKLSIKFTNKEPTLLLDDVFSTLDSIRCKNLVLYLKNIKQTFITTTSIENIPSELLEYAYIVNMKE